MGCINTKNKNEDRKKSQTRWQRLCSRLRRKHKVAPLNDTEGKGNRAAAADLGVGNVSFGTTGTEVVKGNSRGVPVQQGTPMINIERKQEEVVMEQLKKEGIVPRKARGGVAFDITGDNVCERLKPKVNTSVDTYPPIPGVPQYTKEETVLMAQISAEETILLHRPRLLPPLANSYTSEEREIMADIVKSEQLQAKGHMARVSKERRELAKEQRQMKEKERREKVEDKLMKCPVKRDDKKEKMKINEKLERAKLNREMKQHELEAKVERKLARSQPKPQVAKERSDLKQDRARANRELMSENRREKWLRKQERIEEAKRRREGGETTVG